VSITSILLVDLLGLKKLTNAFGILLVFQGVATAIGPPIVGFMYDIFKSYNHPFLFTGLMIAVSGLMCFLIPCFSCYRSPEEVSNNENDDDEDGSFN
jgi:MCP family monocarboxylic acid transporter-like MFS transporter 14